MNNRETSLMDMLNVMGLDEYFGGSESRPPVEGELRTLEREVLRAQIFGMDVDVTKSSPPLISEPIDPNLGPMINRTVTAVIEGARLGDPAAMAFLRRSRVSSNSKSASSPSAGKLVRRMSALADEFDSSAMPFLRSYVVNDRAGMRAAVREILTRRA